MRGIFLLAVAWAAVLTVKGGRSPGSSTIPILPRMIPPRFIAGNLQANYFVLASITNQLRVQLAECEEMEEMLEEQQDDGDDDDDDGDDDDYKRGVFSPAMWRLKIMSMYGQARETQQELIECTNNVASLLQQSSVLSTSATTEAVTGQTTDGTTAEVTTEASTPEESTPEAVTPEASTPEASTPEASTPADQTTEAGP